MKKEKNPQQVRARLLEAAARIVIERGLPGLSLDRAAAEAGVSKGGLIHHFPNRRALVEGMFMEFLERFDRRLRELMAADPEPRGRFCRAYLLATAEPERQAPDGGEFSDDARLLGAATLAISYDPDLARAWRDWAERQLQADSLGDRSPRGRLILYAADGLWLEQCADSVLGRERDNSAVLAELLQLSYTL